MHAFHESTANAAGTVLITGANGFIGSAVVERLLARNVLGLRCLVRSGSDRSRLARLANEARVEIFEGSLASIEAAERAIDGVEVIYHLAAGLRGSAAEIVANTVVTSKNLLEAARRRQRPPKIVLVSSFSVYGVAALPPGAAVDESTPLEPCPERRDAYAFSKVRQERLFRELCHRHGIRLAIARPGAVYGPGGPLLSARVGLRLGSLFFHLGGDNPLPLSYVDNCAEAIAVIGESERAVGQAFNVHDDDLPTARQYLRRYRRGVEPLRVVPIPYPLLVLGSHALERYNRRSRGQLPAVFTPYKTASTYKPQRFDNRKLKQLGWRQLVPTEEALARTLNAW